MFNIVETCRILEQLGVKTVKSSSTFRHGSWIRLAELLTSIAPFLSLVNDHVTVHLHATSFTVSYRFACGSYMYVHVTPSAVTLYIAPSLLPPPTYPVITGKFDIVDALSLMLALPFKVTEKIMNHPFLTALKILSKTLCIRLGTICLRHVAYTVTVREAYTETMHCLTHVKMNDAHFTHIYTLKGRRHIVATIEKGGTEAIVEKYMVDEPAHVLAEQVHRVETLEQYVEFLEEIAKHATYEKTFITLLDWEPLDTF